MYGIMAIMAKPGLCIAGVLGGWGVMIGAYAAHGLENYLQGQSLAAADVAKRLQQCDVAVRYHLIHALALMSLSLSPLAGQWLGRLARLLAVGRVIQRRAVQSVFSSAAGHWATAAGGLCFILGWSLLAVLRWSRVRRFCRTEFLDASPACSLGSKRFSGARRWH